jgi:hypothetical protein
VVDVLLMIASGHADHLTGRVIDARADIERVISRASEVERGAHYALQIRTLAGLPTPVWAARDSDGSD